VSLPPRAAVSLAPSPAVVPADKPPTSSYQVLAGARGVYFSFFGEGDSWDSHREGTAVKSNHWHGEEEFRRLEALETLVCSGDRCSKAALTQGAWLLAQLAQAAKQPTAFHLRREAQLPRRRAKPTVEGRSSTATRTGIGSGSHTTRSVGAARGVLHLALWHGGGWPIHQLHVSSPAPPTRQKQTSKHASEELLAPTSSWNVLKI